MKAGVAAALSLPVFVCGCHAMDGSKIMNSWDPYNDPGYFFGINDTHFASLPLSATLSRRPWSGWSWKRYDGGIAYRWQTRTRPWGIDSPSRDALQRMTEAETRMLSPAEKFDILSARYDYPLFNCNRSF